MSVDTTTDGGLTVAPAPRRRKTSTPVTAADDAPPRRRVPAARRAEPVPAHSEPAAAARRQIEVLVFVDAVGDSAIRHGCGAMVTPLFGVGGPAQCPRCHETV
jgi:hypothetical protein